MKNIHKSNEDEIWEGLYPQILFLIKKNKWTWQSVAALFGFGSAILSFIVGILLPIAAFWLIPDGSDSTLKGISSVFLILILPLLALGAHCLDLLEKKSKDFPATELKSDKFRLYLKPQNTKYRETLKQIIVFVGLTGA